MKKTKTFAFTLAEIMIVLTVIGVLSAILLPVASNSMPDKDILKFKKTHNLLMTAFRELASNGEWFTPGDFSLKPDGTEAGGYSSDGEKQKYYIDALADTLNNSGEVKYVNLSAAAGPLFVDIVANYANEDYSGGNYSARMAMIMFNSPETVDSYTSYFKLSNGVCIGHSWPGGRYEDKNDYFQFMIDIDCEKEEVLPFYYHLRKDGKVVIDARTDWWLKRDIIRKSDECCPKSLEHLYWCAGTETAEGCSDERGVTEICKDDNIPVCAE